MTIRIAESKFVNSLKSVGTILNLIFTTQTSKDPIANENGHNIANSTGIKGLILVTTCPLTSKDFAFVPSSENEISIEQLIKSMIPT